MVMRGVRALILGLGLAVAAANSCSSGTAEPLVDLPPTIQNIAGSYSATSFTGGGYDVLALGGNLQLTLGVDGSLAGELNVPASAGGPLLADMAGTYTINGNRLTFEQQADTFVRDATWTWTNAVLNGYWAGGGETATVRLERISP